MPQDDRYFFYTRGMPGGRWSPVLSANHPDSLASTRNRKGHKQQHTPPMGQSSVKPLAGDDRHLNLGQLRSIYPPPAPPEPPTGPLQPDLRKPRPGEVIGGGYTVFRLGRRSRRIRPAELPFEHATLAGAEAEAQRLAVQNPGLVYEVWGAMTRFHAEARYARVQSPPLAAEAMADTPAPVSP